MQVALHIKGIFTIGRYYINREYPWYKIKEEIKHVSDEELHHELGIILHTITNYSMADDIYFIFLENNYFRCISHLFSINISPWDCRYESNVKYTSGHNWVKVMKIRAIYRKCEIHPILSISDYTICISYIKLLMKNGHKLNDIKKYVKGYEIIKSPIVEEALSDYLFIKSMRFAWLNGVIIIDENTYDECCDETPTTTTIADDTSDEYCDMPDLEEYQDKYDYECRV